jgi:hypothetical protein
MESQPRHLSNINWRAMGTYIRVFVVDGYANERPAHTWQRI